MPNFSDVQSGSSSAPIRHQVGNAQREALDILRSSIEAAKNFVLDAAQDVNLALRGKQTMSSSANVAADMRRNGATQADIDRQTEYERAQRDAEGVFFDRDGKPKNLFWIALAGGAVVLFLVSKGR